MVLHGQTSRPSQCQRLISQPYTLTQSCGKTQIRSDFQPHSSLTGFSDHKMHKELQLGTENIKSSDMHTYTSLHSRQSSYESYNRHSKKQEEFRIGKSIGLGIRPGINAWLLSRVTLGKSLHLPEPHSASDTVSGQ